MKIRIGSKTGSTSSLAVALLLALAANVPLAAIGNDSSPVGLWKSMDEQSGKPKALVRIADNGGELRGKIEKLYKDDGTEHQPPCEHCEGALKNQPIVGMTILSGMKPDDGAYGGGQILDPGNGKTYRSKMTLIEGGKKLQVRGYIGTPLLGRTQTWTREP